MDWDHRWFCCRNCDSYIPTPKAFLDHKKNCNGLNSATDSRAGPNRKQSEKIPEDVNTPEDPKPKEFQRQFRLNFTTHKPCPSLQGGIQTGEKPFVCKLCDYASNVHRRLIAHMKYHSGETPFKCNDCPASFNSRLTLGHHVSRQHPIEEYQPLKSKVELSSGISTDAMSKRFMCEFCEYVTKKFHNLKLHIRTHTGVKPFVCKLCNYACTQSASLTNHNRVHAGDTPFKCNECPASFNKQHALTVHISKQHQERGPNETEPYSMSSKSEFKSCRFCSKVLKCVAERKEHERMHTGERPFKCNKCEASFKQKGHLKEHKVTHNDVKKFKCGFCNYVCHRKQNMITHVRIHTGEKPYKCSQCDAAFRQSTNLSNHMDVHNNVKKYKCKSCFAAYRRLHHLRSHTESQHSTEGYKCQSCKYVTKSKAYLREHSKIHTKKKH